MFTSTPLPMGQSMQRRAAIGAATEGPDAGSSMHDVPIGLWVVLGGVVVFAAWSWYRDYKDLQTLSPKERLEMQNKRMLYGAAQTLAENTHIGI